VSGPVCVAEVEQVNDSPSLIDGVVEPQQTPPNTTREELVNEEQKADDTITNELAAEEEFDYWPDATFIAVSCCFLAIHLFVTYVLPKL
jgi:hypothetical protein